MWFGYTIGFAVVLMLADVSGMKTEWIGEKYYVEILENIYNAWN